jgi:hypothetical protein
MMATIHSLSTPSISGYCWTADLDEYAAASPSVASGTIPLLAPAEADRRARWQRVLAWYGLEERDRGRAARRASRARGPASRDWILVIGEALEPLVRVYAAVTQRPFAVPRSFDEVHRRLRKARARTVLIVADRVCFSGRVLAELERIDVPWGVITGASLASISFSLAKQLLAAPPVSEHVAVDAIARGLWRNGRRVPLDPQALVGALVEDACRSLVVFAHGEGGHLKLPAAVLCGVPGAHEVLAPHIAAAGTCAGNGEAALCKRVQSGDVQILNVGALRAVDMVFLTCSGFSVAGESFPSDVSLVLAAADGYARTAVSPRRPIELAPHLTELCHRTLAADGPAQTIGRCNDVEMWRAGSRPFVLFGDPARQQPQPSFGRDSIAPLVELGAPTSLRGRVVEVVGRTRAFTRTPRGVLVGDDATGATIEDRHAEWQAVRDWAADMTPRLSEAAALERTLRWMSRTGRPVGSARRLQQLAAIRSRLDEQVHTLVVAAAHVERDGLWSPQLGALAQEALDGAAAWDRCFADLANDGVVEGLTILFTPKGRHRAQASSTCRRCQSPRWVEETVSFSRPKRRVMAVCPVCGAQEVWQSGGLRVHGRAPGLAWAGVAVPLTLRVSRAGRPTNASAEVVIAAVDKGRGETFFRRRMAAQGRVDVDIPFPRGTSQDLHTIHVLAVETLEVAYLRIRVPAVTPDVGMNGGRVT